MAATEDKEYGTWVVVGGLIALMFTVGISVARWTVAADVTSVVTAVGSVIGTLVGAFFGIETGSAGKNKADKRASQAEEKAAKLALLVDSTSPDARKILGIV